jgi:hypothetical protein
VLGCSKPPQLLPPSPQDARGALVRGAGQQQPHRRAGAAAPATTPCLVLHCALSTPTPHTRHAAAARPPTRLPLVPAWPGRTLQVEARGLYWEALAESPYLAMAEAAITKEWGVPPLYVREGAARSVLHTASTQLTQLCTHSSSHTVCHGQVLLEYARQARQQGLLLRQGSVRREGGRVRAPLHLVRVPLQLPKGQGPEESSSSSSSSPTFGTPSTPSSGLWTWRRPASSSTGTSGWCA